MRWLAILIRRQARLRAGQVLTLGALTSVAALLLNSALVLSLTYLRSFEVSDDGLRAPDDTAVLMVDAPSESSAPELSSVREHLETELSEQPSIEESNIITTQSGMVTFDMDDGALPTLITVFPREEGTAMSQRRMVDEAPAPVEDPIWAPALLSYSGSYAVGDEITLSTPSGERTFHIQGFYEELFGSSVNMGMLYFMVDEPLDSPVVPGLSSSLTVEMRDGRSGAAAAGGAPAGPEALPYDAAVAAARGSSESTDVSITALWGGNRSVVTEGSAAVGAELFSLSFLMLASVLTVIALIIQRFVLVNLIARDMRAFGVLRAAGFTTTQIIGHVIGLFAGTALLATGLGIAGSYLVLPTIADALAAQSGISWNPPLTPAAALLTGVVLVGAVIVFALVGALRVRRVTAVEALRGGTPRHSRGGDHLPLSSTRGPLNVLLGVKTMLQKPAQSFLVLITVGALTAAPVVALGFGTGLSGDALARNVVGDVGDVTVSISPLAEPEEVVDIVRETPGIASAYTVSWDGHVIDGTPYAVSVLEDYSVWSEDSLVEGRYPQHRNEMAIGASTARSLDLEVGDTHTLTIGGGTGEFVVTGVISTGRNLGLTISVTEEGMVSLDPQYRPAMVTAIAEPEAEVDSVVEDVKAELGEQTQLVESSRESVRVMLGGYLSMISLLAAAVVILTLVVVVLVIGMVASSLIVHSRSEMGVKKAFGFRTRDLTVQVVWSHLPVVALAAVLGAGAGAVAMAPLLEAVFGGIGMVSLDIAFSPLVPVACAAGITASALAVMVLVCVRLRAVSAVELLRT